jgi:hypothetical protein
MYIEGLGYQNGKTGSAQWAGADCEASQIPETFASFPRLTVCLKSTSEKAGDPIGAYGYD